MTSFLKLLSQGIPIPHFDKEAVDLVHTAAGGATRLTSFRLLGLGISIRGSTDCVSVH